MRAVPILTLAFAALSAALLCVASPAHSGYEAPQARIYQAVYELPAGLVYSPVRPDGFVLVMYSTGGVVAYVLRIEPHENARAVMARNDLWVRAMHPGANRLDVDLHGGAS